MTIQPFSRDAAYFQVMRDRSMMVNSEDLDFQFNSLVDYLNTKIVPVINSFMQGQFIGINDPNLSGACLLNVGDGATRWAVINPNIFIDYSIPLSKFTPIVPNSIIASGYDRYFGFVAGNLNDSILFSRNDTTPVWRKVATGDIEDKSLTRNKIDIQAIKIEHLSVILQETLLSAPRVILNNQIVEASIREENLQDYSVTESKIAQNLLEARQKSIDNSNYIWMENSLENRHFAAEILYGGYGVYSRLRNNYFSSLAFRPDVNLDDSINYTFTSDNIIDESITESMIWSGGNYHRRLFVDNFDNGAIETRHLMENNMSLYGFFEQSNGDRIPKEALDPIIRQKLGI